MNKEVNDFLEDTETPILKKQATLTKYLTVRLVLLFLPVTGLIAMVSVVGSAYGLFFYFAGYLYPIIWFVFIIIETIILHFREKLKLRNIDLILIAVFLPIYLLILINHP